MKTNLKKEVVVLKVNDIMTTEVITVSPDTDVTKAAKILLEKSINGLPVVDNNGIVVGILCQSDLIAQQTKFPIPSLFTFLDGLISITSSKQIEKEVQKIMAIKVAQAMTPDPVTVSPETDIETVAALMINKNFHTLPVIDGGQLVGIVGKEDLLKTIVSGLQG